MRNCYRLLYCYLCVGSEVIHCLGPIYGIDQPSDMLLASCYRNALRLAEQNKIASIAFPAISTGAFGYPMEAAARVTAKTLIDMLPRLSTVKHIRFVLFNDVDVGVHESVLENLMEGSDVE